MYAKDLIIDRLKADMQKSPHFVMSGAIGSILWEFANPLFDLAVLLFVPTDIRLERVKARAFENYGEQVLEGGDFYETHQKFYEWTADYDADDCPSVSRKRHEEWAAELTCPVLRLDGVFPIANNAEHIVQFYQQNIQASCNTCFIERTDRP